MINCMWAVDEFTAENGATHLVPGSHKWPRGSERVPEPHEITQGVMPAGSVLIYFGSLLHGGGANRTGSRAPASSQLLPGLAAPVGKPVSRRSAGDRARLPERCSGCWDILCTSPISAASRARIPIRLLKDGRLAASPCSGNSSRRRCSRCSKNTAPGCWLRAPRARPEQSNRLDSADLA